MKTARRPAATAGLMSERGLLPIINVSDGSRSASRTRRRYASTSFSRGVSTRSNSGARPERASFCQLFIALAFREHQQAVSLRKLLQRGLDVGQQRAVALEQMRADSLDLVAQAVVTSGREFISRLMQRPHVRAAAVAMRFDQHDFGAAHRSMNLDARQTKTRIADGGSEVIERLEKMNIGIPERIVGVENEIQRLSRRREHLYREYRRALERAIGWSRTSYARELGSAAGSTISAPVDGLRPTYTSVS